ncbi:type VI secretion system domain-containing protein [Klebsiella variicola]
MKLLLAPKTTEGRYLSVVFILFLLLAAMTFIVWKHPDMAGLEGDSQQQNYWLIGGCCITGCIFIMLVMLLWTARSAGKKEFEALLDVTRGDDNKRKDESENISVSPAVVMCARIRDHLRTRIGIHWRRKVRLLLVTGDEAAIEQLVPGLRQQRWLEGQRTVLIYGGSLLSEPDSQQYAALRKLRRGRPLDGIVRVMPSSLTLTPLISESDLHGLEKISELLGYAAPVWLWKLCDSEWPQADRAVQAVGVSFPLRATEDDVARQLAQMLPTLREQGMHQIAEETRHDFLLRLGQQLIDGEIAQWRRQLAPWLTASRQRLALRGLMFSLPEPRAVDPYQEADTSPASQPHLLTLPATWQGIVDDCRRLRGHHVGMAWERGLACGLLAILGLWAAGLLLSFALNYSQIASVAGKARDLVAHPSVSDYQLTALHALRNEAGRLVHDGQKGAPWYRRFGLDHHQQLLNAVLPWYGVANHRLIRDPANAALQQALNALVNSAPNSDQRAKLAKPGYDQLKAWLMMARPDKADGAFFAQTMKTVQPTRMGISTGLWQSLAPDLWAFYLSLLPERPEWKIIPDAQRVSQSRQVLLQQLGRRNAESTLYENMLKSVRRNFADVSLEDMTSGTDARRLFTTDEVVPGMFTRQAWEGGIQQAIDKAASSRREEIDWVLSDSRKTMSTDLSPEALKARLTRRYFTDFAGSWLNFLNSLRLNPATNIADVTDQLTLISDVRQSPLIALMNTLAWQGQAGQQREGLSDSLIKSAKDLVGGKDKPVIDQSAAGPQGPLDDTFGPLLQLMGKNTGSNVMSADSTLSLQTYLNVGNRGLAQTASRMAEYEAPVLSNITSGQDLLAQARTLTAYLRVQPDGWLAAHRLMKSLRHDTLTIIPAPDAEGKTRIEPPRADQRAMLKRLYLQQSWSEILEQADSTFSRGANHLWLDLQWYIHQALVRSGQDVLADIIIADLKGLLRRLTGLETLAFNDGTPFADEVTLNWINQSVLDDMSVWQDEPVSAASGADNDILALEPEALEKADTDGLDAALHWIQTRPGTESTKEKWLLRLLMARVAEQKGKNDLALYLLRELDDAAGSITLTQWIPALLFEIKSRRLRLLRMKATRSESEKLRLQPEMDQLLAGLIALDPASSAVLCG